MTDFRVKHHPTDYKYELSREDKSVWAHRQIPAWNLSSYQSRIFNQVNESSLCLYVSDLKISKVQRVVISSPSNY